MESTSNPSSNPFSPDEPPIAAAAAARMNREAEIGGFIEAEVERATETAVLAVREEGMRWRENLESLHHTIQGVIENPTLGDALPVSAAVRALVTRITALENRLNVQAPAAENEDVPPVNAGAALLNANTKGILQERCILHEYLAPVYTIVTRAGPPDYPVFTASCTIAELELSVTGVGRNIRAAHQDAAFAMLRRLRWPVTFPTVEERELSRLRRENAAQMED